MIPIKHAPRILKNRNKILIKTYLQRLQNSFLIPFYIFVSLDLDSCSTTPYVFVTSVVLSAIYYVKKQYDKFIYDLVYMTEDNDSVKIIHKISLWLREFILQLMCSTLSFWWVGNVHKCVAIQKINQGYLWLIAFVLIFILHVSHTKYISKTTENIVKKVYDHVDV